jgi:ABC-type sugar transport system ATPase subunit
VKPLIEFNNIEKSFFGIKALSNVNFSIEQGRTLGLIGENGAGKSTLMNILGGNIAPDSGQVCIRGETHNPNNPGDAAKAGIAFIHQELNLFTNLSIADNLFMNRYPKTRLFPFIQKKEMARKTRELLESLQLNLLPNETIEKLQPGERQMVEIAKAFSTGADIFIFDEPTTSLTSRETDRLFEMIRQLQVDGKTIIYISHILEDVLKICHDLVVLRDGSVVEIGSVEEFDIPKMITSMCGCQLDQIYPERPATQNKEELLHVRNLSQPGIVKNINLCIQKGQVVGLFGLMGAGRSELARLIFGLDNFEHGEISIAEETMSNTSPQTSIKHNIAFVTENRREEGLMMEASIRDNLSIVSLKKFINDLKMMNRDKIDSEIENVSGLLRIKTDSIASQAKNLSGGNQQKVVIGKWLLSDPNIFILDEPTRGIDVGAKFEIYAIINELAANGAGILLISSELEELLGMCDKILVMRYGEITGEFHKDHFDDHAILRAAFDEMTIDEP